ncbi:MAG: hypothetical protein CM1200mP2_24800 [Planctomycetaceae bacterium]|nr:MAG: hypothetical protein CM1200mP2_24800 [Planctomycetaceae bacterium]
MVDVEGVSGNRCQGVSTWSGRNDRPRLTYYEHGETPGLGGEVDNPTWKAKWPGRRVFDSEWNVKLQVTKNPVGDFDVDALTGATITSTGVSRMLKFWLGATVMGIT